MRLPPPGVALAAALTTAGCSACGDSGSSVAAASGGGEGAGTAAETTIGPAAVSVSTATSSGTCYGGVQDDPPRPDLIPEGWTPWTCWGSPGRDCILWSPPDPAELDPPLWVPCAEGLPDELACEQMAITWAEAETDEVGTPFLSTSDGVAGLVFERRRYEAGGSETSWIEYIASQPDGPVRAAGRRVTPRSGSCGAALVGGHGERGILLMSAQGTEDDGAVLLSPDGWMLGFRDPEPGLNSWHLSAGQVIQQTYTALIRHDIDFANPELMYQGSVLGNVSAGDDILFSAGDYYEVAIYGWRHGLGLVPLERFPGDVTRGAMGVGGDGEHLVWTRGEGREEADPLPSLYQEYSVMVSPYTLDTAQLEPRRLRSDANGDIGEPWRVGCGLAARGGGFVHDAQVVRLADGVGWTLPPVGDDWEWYDPIGVTCEHVYVHAFVRGETKKHLTVARVRIDSLGEGSPPD